MPSTPTRYRRLPRARKSRGIPQLTKVPTGIDGFDEITGGGLPKGRPTLVCGGPGCGKTLFGLEFLICGAERGDPGVFVTFEETEQDLVENVASLGLRPPPPGRREAPGNRVRPGRAHRNRGDRRVRSGRALHPARSRAPLDRGTTHRPRHDRVAVCRAEQRRRAPRRAAAAVRLAEGPRRSRRSITGERGTDTLTRQGLEEYVSDCVILLDHRVTRPDLDAAPAHREISRLEPRHQRVSVPDRPARNCGAAGHVAAAGARGHVASGSRPACGWLDDMFGGKGYFRASSVLFSGGAGTAKTTLAAHFLDAACRRGERALCFQFEESPAQYCRNMRSVGLDLDRWVKKGLLRIHAARPTLYGLEFHLATMHREVDGLPTLGGGGRSVVELHRRYISGSQQHGDAADRLPQGPTRHRPVHPPDSGQRRLRRTSKSACRR